MLVVRNSERCNTMELREYYSVGSTPTVRDESGQQMISRTDTTESDDMSSLPMLEYMESGKCRCELCTNIC